MSYYKYMAIINVLCIAFDTIAYSATEHQAFCWFAGLHFIALSVASYFFAVKGL